MTATEIGQRIKRERESAGKSQQVLATEARMSTGRLIRYERGEGIKLDALEALAKALGISFGKLLMGDDAQSTQTSYYGKDSQNFLKIPA